jgi:hypothetical protein
MNRLAQVIRLVHIRNGPGALKKKNRENKHNLGEYSLIRKKEAGLIVPR